MPNTNYCSILTQGIYKEACKLQRGGFRNLYVANVGQLDSTTLTADEITAITMDIDPLTTNPYNWFSIKIKKNTGSIANPAQIGTNNKTINQTISFTVEGFKTSLKLRFEELIVSDLVFIAVRHDGTSHMVGRLAGAEMTAGDLTTGVALDDLVGATLEFLADGELEAVKTITAGTTISVLDEDGITVNTVTL